MRPPASYYKDAKKYVALNAYDVDSADHVSIRKALSAGWPVMFGGYVYQAIENLSPTNYFLPMPKGRPVGGHEELIVGHDDNLSHTYPDGKTIVGFYLIRNSWGKAYANKGYYWAPKAYIESTKWNEDFAVIPLSKKKVASYYVPPLPDPVEMPQSEWQRILVGQR
jgi:C1A family cysteine protease